MWPSASRIVGSGTTPVADASVDGVDAGGSTELTDPGPLVAGRVLLTPVVPDWAALEGVESSVVGRNSSNVSRASSGIAISRHRPRRGDGLDVRGVRGGRRPDPPDDEDELRARPDDGAPDRADERVDEPADRDEEPAERDDELAAERAADAGGTWSPDRAPRPDRGGTAGSATERAGVGRRLERVGTRALELDPLDRAVSAGRGRGASAWMDGEPSSSQSDEADSDDVREDRDDAR